MADTGEHTPGPWHVTGSDPNGGMVFAEDNTPVAAWPTHTDSGKQMANAKLMAATPTLLKALKAIRLRVEPGRSHAWTLDDACREVGWVDDECRRAIEAAS